jgi:hypothetical protein
MSDPDDGRIYDVIHDAQQSIAHLLGSVIIPFMVSMLESRFANIPYHTSVLTGQAWVLELLNGHPERIRTELGVHKHVFLALVQELRGLGMKDERNLLLEEQLAIFLYTCVTGLSIRHVGERFQRANGTIAR